MKSHFAPSDIFSEPNQMKTAAYHMAKFNA